VFENFRFSCRQLYNISPIYYDAFVYEVSRPFYLFDKKYQRDNKCCVHWTPPFLVDLVYHILTHFCVFWKQNEDFFRSKNKNYFRCIQGISRVFSFLMNCISLNWILRSNSNIKWVFLPKETHLHANYYHIMTKTWYLNWQKIKDLI
jgi:hypothetical protein